MPLCVSKMKLWIMGYLNTPENTLGILDRKLLTVRMGIPFFSSCMRAMMSSIWEREESERDQLHSLTSGTITVITCFIISLLFCVITLNFCVIKHSVVLTFTFTLDSTDSKPAPQQRTHTHPSTLMTYTHINIHNQHKDDFLGVCSAV